MSNSLELVHSQIMQEPDQWCVTGEMDGISIRGLSSSPDTIIAELYKDNQRTPILIGSVTLNRSAGDGTEWLGIEQIKTVIENR